MVTGSEVTGGDIVEVVVVVVEKKRWECREELGSWCRGRCDLDSTAPFCAEAFWRGSFFLCRVCFILSDFEEKDARFRLR